MKKILFISGLCCFLLFGRNVQLYAEEYGTDVSGYLGKTVGEVMRDFPDIYQENDRQGSGRDFFTNGKVCFYYEYMFSEDDNVEDKRINRIVLNGGCGADYRIDRLPGYSTYNDENMCLTSMGYEFICGTGDQRHIWKDEEGHLMIVTRGMYAGAVETDYSLITSYEFWD